MVQILSGTILDDISAAYVLAVENFERTATSVAIELGAGPAPAETSTPDAPPANFAGNRPPSSLFNKKKSVKKEKNFCSDSCWSHFVINYELVTTCSIMFSSLFFPCNSTGQSAISSSVAPITSHVASKAAEEKERRVPIPKTNIETRKTGRKLVRPRLVKPDEPQGDVDMPDVDGSNTQAKVAPSHEPETQRNLNLPSQPTARKRLASSASELSEQPLNQGETSSDTGVPAVKKPKGSNFSLESTEGQTVTPTESTVIPPAVEEASIAVADVTNEEGGAEKDEGETIGEKNEVPKDSEQLDDPIESQNEKNNVGEETLENPSGIGGEFDGNSKDQAVEENQQSVLEFESEKEEGELVPDIAEAEEGTDTSNAVGSPEVGEVPEGSTTPVASPARIDDEAVVSAGVELGEINSPEAVNEEKNDEGDVVEETVEGSDKSNDGNDQITGESDQIPETALVPAENTTATMNAEVDVSKQATETEEVKQVSPASNTSTVVNLAERAKERAMLRQSGSAVLSPPGSRGRGRQVRGRAVRGARGGRTGRGHTPGQQG